LYQRPGEIHDIPPTSCFATAHIVLTVVSTTYRQRTLEELDYVFAVPTRRHAAYQLHTWLPWFIKRWVFFDRKAELRPLYQLQGFERGNAVEYGGVH